jgi:integrase
MVELVASNPMRAINIAEMKYKPGCKGYPHEKTNLYKTPDGHYRLKYEVHELKNGMWQGRYDLAVNREITKDLDEYLSKWRPLLVGADGSDYVLRPVFETPYHKADPDVPDKWAAPLTGRYLSDIMFVVAQIYLGCAGFGLHAARHFVATEHLKHHPGAYKVAAVVLHDSEEMVRDTYSWVTPDNIAAFWNEHLSGIIRKSRKGVL